MNSYLLDWNMLVNRTCSVYTVQENPKARRVQEDPGQLDSSLAILFLGPSACTGGRGKRGRHKDAGNTTAVKERPGRNEEVKASSFLGLPAPGSWHQAAREQWFYPSPAASKQAWGGWRHGWWTENTHRWPYTDGASQSAKTANVLCAQGRP